MVLQVAVQDIGQLPYIEDRLALQMGKLGPDTALSSPVVTFPEAVALAEMLTGSDWHRPVAAPPARQADQFYRRVSARLGEGTYQAPSDDDPIIVWAQPSDRLPCDWRQDATARRADA